MGWARSRASAGTSLGGYVIADQFQRVEDRPVLGDDRVEGLVPSERVSRDDCSIMLVDDAEEIGQLDARRDLLERG